MRCAFPIAQEVARFWPEKFQPIGFSRQKAHALLSLAQAITRNELDLEALVQEDDAVIRQRLLELQGAGRWTAEYVLLRGLGKLDVFQVMTWALRRRWLDGLGVLSGPTMPV